MYRRANGVQTDRQTDRLNFRGASLLKISLSIINIVLKSFHHNHIKEKKMYMTFSLGGIVIQPYLGKPTETG